MSRRDFIDVDLSELLEVARTLEASTPQFKKALHRAAVRTATTLKTMVARGLKNELQLRTVNLLRKRLKLKGMTHAVGGDPQLWIGSNEMPASWFKGRPKKTKQGAEKLGHEFKGAFVAGSKFKGRRTIFKRSTESRLPIAEQNLPVSERVEDFLDDQIIAKAAEIYWKHFNRDLRARVSYQLGEK